jgi:hypothetical protein
VSTIALGQYATPTLAAGAFSALRVDSAGALVITGAGGSGITVNGSHTAADAYANPTDAIDAIALLAGFNGATWDRLLSGQVGAISAANLLKILNVIPTARYNSAAIVMADAAARELQLTQEAWLRTCEQQAPQYEDNTNGVNASVSKPLAVNTYAPSLFTNFGANATLNVKASAGNLFTFTHYNLNAATRYLQFHNTATTPAGAAVPLLTFPVPGSSAINLGPEFFTANGIYFSTGIAFAFSTTQGTYTAGTAGEQFTQATFK